MFITYNLSRLGHSYKIALEEKLNSFIKMLKSCIEIVFLNYGGDDRNRTCDPLRAKQVLSQLSYTPKYSTTI
jgi:hypothetical protein